MKLLILLFSLTLGFSSCSDKLNDLSGTYQNIKDFSETKIERTSDNDYLLISPDGKYKVPVKRNGNILSGTFKGSNISCEFNSTFDTIVNKLNENEIFKCKKISKS